MTGTDTAVEELKRAGFYDKDSAYEGMLGPAVEELLRTFGKQGHSGMSAATVLVLFDKVAKGDVLSPITSDPSEWTDVAEQSGRTLWQSRRCPYVFTDNLGEDTAYSIEGKVFSDDNGETYFQSKESRVNFDLPGYPPEKEYVIYDLEVCRDCKSDESTYYVTDSDDKKMYRCIHMKAWHEDDLNEERK